MPKRSPQETEQEYIARQELEARRRAAEERRAELAEAEKTRLRELHWMRCPKCGSELAEVHYREVKVDRCFSCGGTYLDDGELEQLVGNSGSELLSSLRRFLKGD